MKPLENIRILDLTNVLAGPFCCHQLAHMGAEVIKVEIPKIGDLARQLGADSELNEQHMGVSFLAQNSGKKSITINLKNDQGKQLFKQMVRDADVVVENFRPGVMDRLGVGYETLLQENSSLVYCAISGFGQDGPLKDLPAYDQIIQGMSGVMSITGSPDSAPLRVGYPMADSIGGMTAAFAIASALYNHKCRPGCFLDISLLESVISTMGWVVSNYLVAGKEPQPMGNDNFTASPSGAFKTGDGLINIAANKQQQFEAVCHILELPELIEDPRFSQRAQRLKHRQELKQLLETAMQSNDAEYWRTQFNAAGIPAGCVASVEQALAQEQIATRGLIATFSDTQGLNRDIKIARPGIKLNGQPLTTSCPPPALGQHSDEILADMGYNLDQIAQLKQDGVV
ncbi:MAG: CoA transferase [Rhizobiales bacterium]|nr:CoA transferase [Hyphomicrobiales bacterium]NRB13124.1 CoA transferase [Hyphomicrobiales bacterium]